MARGLFDKSRDPASPADSAAGRTLDKKKLAPIPLPKRKNSSQEESGGGGGGHDSDDTLWLYSFNDMLFNLLLFFIVMYSISQIDEKKFAEVQQALQGDKKPVLLKDDEKDGVVVGPRNGALDAKQLGSSGGEAGGDKSAEIAAAIRFMLDRSEKAKVKLAKGTGNDSEKKEQEKKKSKYISGTNVPLPMKLVFPHTEFFQKGTAELTPDGAENLLQLAGEINAVEKLGRAEIEVHTEFSREMIADLKGQSQFSTLKIATMRAGVMFEYFVKGGVPHKKVVSAGYADGRPIVLGENLTPQQRADFSNGNDRVVISLMKEKSP